MFALILFLSSIIVFGIGDFILSEAKSAIHEIEAFILFLIGAVSLSSSFIIDTLCSIREDIHAVIPKDKTLEEVKRLQAQKKKKG